MWLLVSESVYRLPTGCLLAAGWGLGVGALKPTPAQQLAFSVSY